jgi:hypothetical protein
MQGETIYPYMGVQYKKQLAFGNRQFLVFIASAYNAGGLIGPESNGIVVADDTRRQLVLDQHCKQQSGYFGASAEQIAEFERICAMDWNEFRRFCNGNARSRQHIDEVIPNLRKPAVFKADAFIATEWSTPKDKADFANELVRFIKSGFHKKYWTKKLYVRLNSCFGHIAHYDASGFYETWFSSANKQNQWLDRIRNWRPYGDPAYTYCDVEKAFVNYLKKAA